MLYNLHAGICSGSYSIVQPGTVILHCTLLTNPTYLRLHFATIKIEKTSKLHLCVSMCSFEGKCESVKYKSPLIEQCYKVQYVRVSL